MGDDHTVDMDHATMDHAGMDHALADHVVGPRTDHDHSTAVHHAVARMDATDDAQALRAAPQTPVSLSRSARPSRCAGVVMAWAGDTLHVHTKMPPCRHALNVSAASVWLLCDGSRSQEAIASELERLFPGEAPCIQGDVARTLRDLRSAGLIGPHSQDQGQRPIIRVAFSNFPPGYDVHGSYFTWLLTHLGDVLLVDPASGRPDVLFYSAARAWGFDHRDTDRAVTRKILVTDDAAPLDFSECDFAFSPHPVAAEDIGRHYRLPCGCVRIDSTLLERPGSSEHYAADIVCARLQRVLFGPAPERRGPATLVRAVQPAALTIGMATFDDYDGVYFTIQAIRLYHPEVTRDTEILIVDNNPEGPCARALQDLETWVERCRYIPSRDIAGTAVRNVVFDRARTDFVLCLDSHVLVAPGAIRGLIGYLEANPGCRDLLQGPLVMDNLETVSTHFDAAWRDGMYGTWATDERGVDPRQEPFEVPMQGLGLFACRKDAWLGFNPRFRGFGGEEGYIHEKFRQAGHRTLCLPFLRWIHRFNRPLGAPYRPRWEDRIRNYFIGFRELGLDTSPMEAHFAARLGAQTVHDVTASVEHEPGNPFDFFETICCINRDADVTRWARMRESFARLGILRRVKRFSAVETPWNHHIGCALSHRAILAEARAQRSRNVLVFEDDALFLERTLPYLDENLDELAQIEWDVFHLGGCRWGNVYPKAAGCRVLERVTQLTCTHAVAYNHTVYDRLLGSLPDNVAEMAPWIEHHAAIDQYLNHIERRFISWPVLASQPGLLPQEHPDHRDRFVV